MFKEMKIQINKDQPLDAVVGELERIGYTVSIAISDEFVYTNDRGMVWLSGVDINYSRVVTTTLAELKEM